MNFKVYTYTYLDRIVRTKAELYFDRKKKEVLNSIAFSYFCACYYLVTYNKLLVRLTRSGLLKALDDNNLVTTKRGL